jgi:polyisoprenoid-binding protein YceI
MKQMTLLLSVLALSLNVFAAGKKADKKAAAAAETYKVDTAASTIEWKGSKKVGSSHMGNIKVQSGEFMVENNMIKTGQVVADMKSISNTDIKDADNNKKLVGHLSSADFFNVEKNPTATFKVTSVTPGKGKVAGEVTVKGEFTMIGATQPIEFPAIVTIKKGIATGKGTAKIDRTKFGLKYNSGNFFKDLAGDKIINDEFELTLNLVAKK